MNAALSASILFADTPPLRWRRLALLAPLLGFVFIAVTDVAGGLLMRRLGLVDGQWNPIGASGFATFLLLPFGLLWLLLWAWVRGVERRSLRAIGVDAARPWRKFALGIGCGVAGMLAIIGMIGLFGGYQMLALAPVAAQPSALLMTLALLACFAVQASSEELLFRGWLLAVLAQRYNLVVAVLLSTALFALLHHSAEDSWLVTSTSILFALFTSLWAIRARSLLGVMGWHTGWNWINAVGFDLPITGFDAGVPALLVQLQPQGPGWLNGGGEGPEGSLFCVLFLVLGIVWLAWRGRAVRPS